jgi:multidrug efflux pump subunit AcrA (membrane-fusion protein)
MSTRKALTFGGVAVTAALLGVWGITGFIQTGSSAETQPKMAKLEGAAPSGLRIVEVKTGDEDRTIRVTGTTAARHYASIAALRMRGPDSGRALVLIYLAKSGSMIKKGEVVAQIDGQSLKDHVDEVHSQVVQAESDIRKRKAELAIDWENLQQTVREAKAELDQAKLDASASEVRTPVDVELLKLAVEESEAHYKQVQQDLKTKQESYRAEMRILELTRDRHQRHRDRHAHDLERFTMRAPMDGLVVMESIWRGGQMGQVEQGDQVAPGQPFMKIVDTSSMQLTATVSQVGSDELRLGQMARIYFDAFSDLKLDAKVFSIGAIASGGWRQNYYIRNLPLTLSINSDDPRVIPDLSASAEIVVGKHAGVTVIPSDAVHASAGRVFVYVVKNGGFEPRDVELGLRNARLAEITQGLRVGEQVLVGAPPAS